MFRKIFAGKHPYQGLFSIKTYNLIRKRVCRRRFSINPLRANPTKLSNTLKQSAGNLLTNCLSVFDDFVGLELIQSWFSEILKTFFLQNTSRRLLLKNSHGRSFWTPRIFFRIFRLVDPLIYFIQLVSFKNPKNITSRGWNHCFCYF